MAARKFTVFILLSIVGCTLSIILCGVSVGTKEWYRGVTKTRITQGGSGNQTTVSSEIKTAVQINHGLFQGSKTRFVSGARQQKYSLNVVCLASEGLCMFSCGKDSVNREKDITLHIEGNANTDSDTGFCEREPVDEETPEETGSTTDGTGDRVFLSFALWLITLISIGGAILFSLIGAILGLYNTYSAPFQPILSVFGLYIWNGIAAGCILLTMILWGIAFATNLSKTAAVSDTLSGYLNSDGNGSLGYSYWILLAAEFLHLGNIALLRYRTWKIVNAERNNTRVMDVKLTQGEILLF